MQSNQEVDLTSTARIGLILLSSVLAWACGGLLLFSLAAMQWLWRVRRDARSGALDAAAASRCYNMIEGLLGSTYVALVIIETTLT
jgi:uncharacterized membrane protein YdcZ (DUF606 family)